MKESEIIIRLERSEDYRIVENLVRESFWNVYRPGSLEHYLIHELRKSNSFIHDLDYVMEKEGNIIGVNVFVKTEVETKDDQHIPVLTMGPICIEQSLKRQGYGQYLVDYTTKKAKELGYGAIFIEGNIEFYKHCGFDYASNYGIGYNDLTDDIDTSFFLCKELVPGYLDGVEGTYRTPEAYFIDENKAEMFDQQFPQKTKDVLKTQIF